MMIHDRLATTPMQPAASDACVTPAERTDDACRHIHLYQQQLRAELLAGVSADRGRALRGQGWLSTCGVWPGQAAAAMRAIERRVRALTEAGGGNTYRQAASFGQPLAEA